MVTNKERKNQTSMPARVFQFLLVLALVSNTTSAATATLVNGNAVHVNGSGNTFSTIASDIGRDSVFDYSILDD